MVGSLVLFRISFGSFSCLIALAATYRMKLNRSLRRDIPVWSLSQKEGIQPLCIKPDVLHQAEKSSFHSYFAGILKIVNDY